MPPPTVRNGDVPVHQHPASVRRRDEAPAAAEPVHDAIVREAIEAASRYARRVRFPHVALSDEERTRWSKRPRRRYGDDEQRGGLAVMIEDNLEVPFETTVLRWR